MIAITCSACQKKGTAKDSFAGKKVKCPGCGQVLVVPAIVAAPPVDSEEMPTLPPTPSPEAPAPAPPEEDSISAPTHPPSEKPDATHGFKNDPGHDSSLTDFLAPPQADDELGRLGEYRILKILGAGGMGVVFLAEDIKLARKVAIKAMLPHLAQSKSSQQRFLREARAAAAFEHDHIVAIHHVSEDRGAPYIVMPFLKGEPLDERLKRAEPIPLTEILRIGREVAAGLAAAHVTGLVHRDIKPANIWLEKAQGQPSLGFDRVKILDFGLARASSTDSGLTQQGAIMGTPAYMAPEQGRGDEVDGRSDLFSLGVVLYRLCSGELPFKGKDTVSTIMEVATHEPTPPGMINVELPQELSDLVMQLLEKEAEKRPTSAKEVVERIQAIEAEDATARTQYRAGIDKTMRAGSASHSKVSRKQGTDAPTENVTRGPSKALLGAGLVAGIGVLAICVVGALFAYFFTRSAGSGMVRLEALDPEIQITFDANGPTIQGGEVKDVPLSAGSHRARVTRGELQFDTETFVVKKDETTHLKIDWSSDGKLQAVRDGVVLGAKAWSPVAGEWKQLFNGANLTGWKTFPGDVKPWTLTKGAQLFAKTNSTPGCLFTERDDYENFRCVIEAKGSGNYLGGVYFRSKFGPGANQAGYLAVITADTKAKSNGYNGSLFGLVNAPEVPVTLTEWFKMEIIVRGNHIVTKVNDKTVVNFIDKENRHQKGHLALVYRVGSISIRKVELMELPPGPGPFSDDPEPKVQEADWVPLASGNDRSAWKESSSSKWDLTDGVITGSNPKKGSVYLNLNDRKFKDFELKFQVKLQNGKAGLRFRGRAEMAKSKIKTIPGPSIDFEPGSWGSLSDDAKTLKAADFPLIKKLLKVDDFNDFHVKCIGKRCTIQMNDVVIVDDDFPSLPDEGTIGLYLGPVAEARFRNIFVRELNAAKN